MRSKRTRVTGTLARAIASREIDARDAVARQDLQFAQVPIVTPTPLGDSGRQWIETRTVYDGVTLEVAGPELDTQTDLPVLLALLVLAARQQQAGSAALVAGESVDGLLAGDGDARPNALRGEPVITVQTTVAEITETAGLTVRSGRERARVRKTLARLMGIVLTATSRDREKWGATHLIAAAAGDRGAMTITIDYRATRAVVGDGQWSAIPLGRLLDATPVERAVLYRLCAHCTGHPLPISLERLTEVCWTRKASSPRRQRERAEWVRTALESGAAVPDGWAAKIGQDGIVKFERR